MGACVPPPLLPRQQSPTTFPAEAGATLETARARARTHTHTKLWRGESPSVALARRLPKAPAAAGKDSPRLAKAAGASRCREGSRRWLWQIRDAFTEKCLIRDAFTEKCLIRYRSTIAAAAVVAGAAPGSRGRRALTKFLRRRDLCARACACACECMRACVCVRTATRLAKATEGDSPRQSFVCVCVRARVCCLGR